VASKFVARKSVVVSWRMVTVLYVKPRADYLVANTTI
jgi:hypothetical protein